MSPSLIDYL